MGQYEWNDAGYHVAREGSNLVCVFSVGKGTGSGTQHHNSSPSVPFVAAEYKALMQEAADNDVTGFRALLDQDQLDWIDALDGNLQGRIWDATHELGKALLG